MSESPGTEGNDLGYVIASQSSRYFRNIESYPGQLWYTPDLTSSKRETQIGRRDAVRQGRALERTSATVRAGIEKKTDMVVGPRLFVQPTPDWDILTGFSEEQQVAYSDACLAQFNNWGFDTSFFQDAEQMLDFGGLMHLGYRGLAGPDAECLGVIHYDEPRRQRLGANWATCVQIVDPDRLQTPGELTAREGVDMFEGKVLDEYGAWETLYISKKHPSDVGNTGLLSDYAAVPRRTPEGRPVGFHYFEKMRPGAQRGLTSLITIIKTGDQLDQFDKAQLDSAILNTIYALYAKTLGDPETLAEQMAPSGEDGVSPFERKLDFYKGAKIRIGGARVAVLPPGDELVMEAVNRAAQDATPFVNLHIRKIAAALGTTFSQTANNWSDANYNAARMEILDVWRDVFSRRTRFCAAVPALIYGAVIEEAIVRGRIPLPPGAPPFRENRFAYTRCSWTGPAMPEADPLKAAQAMEIRLRTRTSNRQMECADRGVFYYDVFKQHGIEIREAKDLEFDLEPPLPGQADGEGGDMPGEPGTGEPEDKSGNERRAAKKD